MADPISSPQLAETARHLLSPGEAVLLLVLLTGALFLGFSAVLAVWTLRFRARKRAREIEARDRTGRWQTELREVLYGRRDGADLEASVDAEESIHFLNFLLDYVRRLDGEEREAVRRLARPHLARIVGYLDHPVEARRARAVQTLGELGLPEYGDAVTSALDDPSDDVAMAAAATLAAAEDGAYADAVLAHLDRFAHWRLDFLVAMLASLGSNAAPALRWTLGDDEVSPRPRAVAADALALLGDAAAADVGYEALVTTSDVELRAAALRLLASVGRGEHVAAVRTLVRSDALPVRLHAVRALGSLGTRDDLAVLDEAAREDASPWVAIAAARALRQAGGADRLELLAGSDHPRAALGLQVISEVPSW